MSTNRTVVSSLAIESHQQYEDVPKDLTKKYIWGKRTNEKHKDAGNRDSKQLLKPKSTPYSHLHDQ